MKCLHWHRASGYDALLPYIRYFTHPFISHVSYMQQYFGTHIVLISLYGRMLYRTYGVHAERELICFRFFSPYGYRREVGILDKTSKPKPVNNARSTVIFDFTYAVCSSLPINTVARWNSLEASPHIQWTTIRVSL